MTTRRLALAASAATLLATAAPAAAAPVTSGKLEWTMNSHYASGDPQRTALGYFLDPTPDRGSQGSATPAAPATLSDASGNPLQTIAWNSKFVTDRDFTLGFPAASGDYAGGVATVELDGSFTFVTHTLPVTFEKPLLKLDGTAGTIVASGTRGGMSGTAPYDRSLTQFKLDLSNATVATRVDGAKVISGIVPLGTTDTFISFGANARLFGTMKLTLAVNDPTPLAAPKDGAPGPQGPAGPAGRSALIKTISLKRAPFAGKGEHRVKLLDRKSRAVLASGTVKKRTLRVMYLEGSTLKGSYTLRLSNGNVKGKREATVSVG